MEKKNILFLIWYEENKTKQKAKLLPANSTRTPTSLAVRPQNGLINIRNVSAAQRGKQS